MTLLTAEVKKSRPDVIIHLGAGRGQELDEYLSWEPERIVLVEADPEKVSVLLRRTSDLKQVEVIPAAITSKGDKALLNIYNHSAFNSLRSPTALRELFPGLRLLKEIDVAGLNPVALIEEAEITAEKKNWLVIDVPGEEAEVLETLNQAGRLHLFDRILLHCGRRALYESGSDADALLGVCERNDFETVSCMEDTDPDRPCWVLQRNRLKTENRDLLSRLDELERKREDQAKLVTEFQEHLEQVNREKDAQSKLAVERQAKIEELIRSVEEKSGIEAESKSQLETLQGRLEQMQKSCEEKDRITADRKAKLEQAGREKTEQSKQIEKLQSKVEQLIRSRRKQTKLAIESRTLMKQANQERAEQSKHAADRQTKIEELVRSLEEKSRMETESKIRLETLQNQLSQTRKALEEQNKLAADRQAQLEQANRKIGEQSKLAAERQAKVEQLIKTLEERSKLASELQSKVESFRNQLEQTHKAREEQGKLATDRQARIKQLETNIAEFKSRQGLMAEEIARAEGQIDLIKDVLFQDSGL